MYGMNANFRNMSSQNPTLAPAIGKGKGKMTEADFEAAFMQAMESIQPKEASNSRIVEISDSNTGLEESFANAHLTDTMGDIATSEVDPNSRK
jgi:peroxin-5